VISILGIDAAWTPNAPSGMALVGGEGTSWQCLAVAPSDRAFIEFARGRPVDWHSRPITGGTDVRALLEAAEHLAKVPVDLVAIDMPVSKLPIAGRREAERVVSRLFGARGISTHSPTAERPGRFGATLTAAFGQAGYAVATSLERPGAKPRLLEVYPHPALLTLLGRPRRVQYKVSRSGRYWPKTTPAVRAARLLHEYSQIYSALQQALGRLPFALPTTVRTLGELKRYEDALDALVCCWVGVLYARGAAVAHGDRQAAIWCPREAAAADQTQES
jgi:predicted RNase H-like nuclease